jgi:nucleoid-associated protein YgaU
MYVLHGRPELVHRWHPEESLLWRARWVVLALLAAALVALVYARAAGVGAAAEAGAPVRYDTVTVAAGDTLWTIATRRYPHADARQKVGEIEQANGLSGPTIEPGQRLKLPSR